jgi:hypothetical protein
MTERAPHWTGKPVRESATWRNATAARRSAIAKRAPANAQTPSATGQ